MFRLYRNVTLRLRFDYFEEVSSVQILRQVICGRDIY